ncbi:hypothetical protein H8E88_28635 [candidate division KSB1 bacterium]|nr:hypothetical protein [candidate division KSB1 bacterium]MBL7092935.1 hypothetical protein [candidate division KSB1 bacterium]
MKKKLLSVITMTMISLFFVNLLVAQPRSRRLRRYRPKAKQTAALGIRLGNDFKNEQLLAGGHFWLPIGILWKFVPGADYYFTKNDSSRWQFNGDFLFKPMPNGMFYFGGGVAAQYLNAADINEPLDFGGNLIVGLDFGSIRGPAMSPYFQARWTFINKERYFSVLGGVNLILK